MALVSGSRLLWPYPAQDQGPGVVAKSCQRRFGLARLLSAHDPSGLELSQAWSI